MYTDLIDCILHFSEELFVFLHSIFSLIFILCVLY
jgi:hypothetical protein